MSVKLRARNHPSLQGRFSVMLLIMEAYEMSQYRSGKCEEWRRLMALLAWTGRARTVEQTHPCGGVETNGALLLLSSLMLLLHERQTHNETSRHDRWHCDSRSDSSFSPPRCCSAAVSYLLIH